MFHPRGDQVRCEDCMWMTCETCKKRFRVRDGKKKMRFCSVSCKGKAPSNVARLRSVRGTKPRTYHLRRRDKHGGVEDREWRTLVFQRDAYTCQSCGQRGGRLEAHHIKPYKAYPELRHVLDNGQTLCKVCHSKTDTYGWANYWKNNLSRQETEPNADGVQMNATAILFLHENTPRRVCMVHKNITIAGVSNE